MGDVIGTSAAENLTENPWDGVSVNTNNTFYGLEGNDTIVAGPATQTTYVNNHVDTHVVQDNDVIVGGAGNDTMTGGYGNDQFVFNFLVSAGGSHHVDLSAVTHIVVGGQSYDKPSVNASLTAWNNWNAAMEAYVTSLGGVATHHDFVNSNPGAPRNSGHINLVDGYDIGGGAATIAGEGNDTVRDFTHAGSGSNDSLLMNGLSADSTAVNYWGAFLHLQEDGDSTTITWTGGSIDLVGVHGMTLQQMVDQHWIVFA